VNPQKLGGAPLVCYQDVSEPCPRISRGFEVIGLSIDVGMNFLVDDE
jgi:hypothetical protein